MVLNSNFRLSFELLMLLKSLSTLKVKQLTDIRLSISMTMSMSIMYEYEYHNHCNK